MLQERKKKKKKKSGRADHNSNGGTGGVAILIGSSTSTSSTVIFDDDENMVVEILSRLPVKSLLRFKCVSKRWCSLIQDPYFVDLHSTRSITRPGATFFISRYLSGFHITFFGSTSYDGPNFYAVDYVSFIGDPARRFDTFGPHFYIQRYNNSSKYKLTSTQILKNIGLLLMSFKEETLWIINPSIRKTILLTKTNFKEEEAIKNKDVVHPVGIHWMNLDYYVEPKYGFGFDPVTKKYKVICICKVEKYYVPPQFFHYDPIEFDDDEFYPQLLTMYYRCKVLTIEDCCWRTIDEIPPRRRLAGDPVYLNGAIYWMTWSSLEEDDHDDQLIVAFDISTEKFSVIKTPANLVCSRFTAYMLGHIQNLYEVDGCLAILDNNSTTGRNTIEIWKLVVEPAEAAAAKSAADCCWVKETILTLSFDWRKEGYLFEVIEGTNQILLKRSSPAGTSFCYFNRDNYFVDDDHENKTKKKTSTCDGKKQLEFTDKAASFIEKQLPAAGNSRSFHTCTESLWSLNSSSTY